MSTADTTEAVLFEPLEYDDRYYIQTAKNSIESLAHIVGEAGSNADEAISKRAKGEGQPDRGAIEFAYDPVSMELSVTDDGIGLTAERMKKRLRRVGARPEEDAKRGFFHRGIREVFLAMGGGRIVSIGRTETGDVVISEAVFDPKRGMALVRINEELTETERDDLGLENTGTRVTIPMRRFAAKKPRQYEFGAIEVQIRDCVQIRPVAADPDRKIVYRFGDEKPRRLQFVYPEGEDLVAEKRVEIGGQAGTFWAKAAEEAIKSGRTRQTRRHGILIRGERAAYEVSLGEKLRSHPGMSRVFGELRIDSIERLQREADAASDAEESQLVYKPDRSGLNPEHPLVEGIYDFIDQALGPLVADLETEKGKKEVSPDMRRQLAKLARVINEVVRDEAVGDLEDDSGEPKDEAEEDKDDKEPPEPPTEHERTVDEPIDFAYDRIFIPAGRSRTVKVWFDGSMIKEGAEVEIESSADEIVHSAKLSGARVPAAAADGIAELELTIKAGNDEGRHEVRIWAEGGYLGILPVHVRFPRASGFISQIVPVDEDWPSGGAWYDPSTGIVKVFVGRPEFKDAEKRAKSEGKEPNKAPLYRQLMVESVREAALRDAAKRRAEVEWDDLPAEERNDRNAFHDLVVAEFLELDYKLRAALLKSFVDVS